MPITLADRLNRWQVLNTNFKQHLEEMPELQPKQAELEQIIDQDLALAAEYSQLIGSARDIVRRREALAKKGNQLRSLFAAALRNHLGPESQKLNEFGIRPKGLRRRKKVEAKPDPTPTTEPVTPVISARPTA